MTLLGPASEDVRWICCSTRSICSLVHVFPSCGDGRHLFSVSVHRRKAGVPAEALLGQAPPGNPICRELPQATQSVQNRFKPHSGRKSLTEPFARVLGRLVSSESILGGRVGSYMPNFIYFTPLLIILQAKLSQPRRYPCPRGNRSCFLRGRPRKHRARGHGAAGRQVGQGRQ